MNKYNVINFHITDKCNFSCKYCFGKFNASELSLNKAKKVIDSVERYFIKNDIKDGRINFAGGEPLLYPYLDGLIDYCSQKKINVSIVTNGFLLTSSRIYKWKNKVCQIGISIDSKNEATNFNIGRSNNKKTVSENHLIDISSAIKECGISLKINTVVSSLNLNEDLTELYLKIMPEKVKLFKMHIVNGINDACKNLSISNNDFYNHCDKYKNLPFNVVIENQGDMENSYLMIDPSGTLIINNNGKYEKFRSLIEAELYEEISNLPLQYSKFMQRYKMES